MLFTNTTFLFIFFPLSVLFYFLISALTKDIRLKNLYIFVTSLLFYSWGNVYHVIVLLSVIFIDYILGIKMSKPNNKTYFIIGLLLNLGLLCTYKYSNFFLDNLNSIFDSLGIPISFNLTNLSIPIGLSFFIFQSISYLFDIYRGKSAPQKNIVGIGIYISFFANITSGPIIRYENFERQLLHRNGSLNNIYPNLERLIIGLGKKIFLSIPLGIYADKIFLISPSEQSILISWLGIILYTLQIYIDFSSYSDMAISLAGIFGFDIKENFNYPYVATSIQDFWRRWHISLSTWFKEYLYIPLGGNRKGKLMTCRNTIIVFILCGFWHGANWTFILWGLYYGLILSLERIWFKKVLDKLFVPLRHIYTILIVMIGWVLFRSTTLSYALSYLSTMFGFNNSDTLVYLKDIFNIEILVVLVISLLISNPLLHKLFMKLDLNKTPTFVLRFMLIIIVLFIGFIWLSPTIKGSLTIPFIYTKF